ncbi:hypothetical protein Tco_0280530 [Tanacetum coccineum]
MHQTFSHPHALRLSGLMTTTCQALKDNYFCLHVDLKHETEGFHDATYKANENTDAALRIYQQILNFFKTYHNTGLRRILNNLQEVQNAVKEDLNLNKKTFDFSGLRTTVDSLNAAITAQNDHLAKWVEFSALLAWSVGPRMNRIENTQASIQSDLASLKHDTLNSRI